MQKNCRNMSLKIKNIAIFLKEVFPLKRFEFDLNHGLNHGSGIKLYGQIIN